MSKLINNHTFTVLKHTAEENIIVKNLHSPKSHIQGKDCDDAQAARHFELDPNGQSALEKDLNLGVVVLIKTWLSNPVAYFHFTF